MDELSLTERATTRVSLLSGGQRKRCSIGAELLTQPRIFFLDEPTSGLDPATETQMMRLLARLTEQGSTVILTTHATKNLALRPDCLPRERRLPRLRGAAVRAVRQAFRVENDVVDDEGEGERGDGEIESLQPKDGMPTTMLTRAPATPASGRLNHTGQPIVGEQDGIGIGADREESGLAERISPVVPVSILRPTAPITAIRAETIIVSA